MWLEFLQAIHDLMREYDAQFCYSAETGECHVLVDGVLLDMEDFRPEGNERNN
jgi:hypothetical protein